MFPRIEEIPRLKRCVASVFLAMLLVCIVAPAYAQFNSGSTGADGAFAPAQSMTVQLPESGVFNYTTVNIPANVFISYKPNSKNTPVTILASGNVTISGRIFLDGAGGNGPLGGAGGPGGFRGGNGGQSYNGGTTNTLAGTAGDGPGGGAGGPAVANGTDYNGGGGGGFATTGGAGGGPNPGAGGPRYGTATLLPLIGGSGGGGGGAATEGFGGGGGGGGGAILIASSGTITFVYNGDGGIGIYARGGGGSDRGGNAAGGSGGSGGAIRLIANTVSGGPNIYVNGGSCAGPRCTGGGWGYVRAEAFDLTGFNPSITTSTIITSAPNPVKLTNEPKLTIASVGGIAAPANPLGSFYRQPDITVPTSVANPVTVNIQANNLPVGTVVQVTLTQDSGVRTTVNSTPLSGSQASSTASASVTLPATGVSVISATATLNTLLAYGGPLFINGERIDKVEIAAAFGGESQVTYITASGQRLKWPQ